MDDSIISRLVSSTIRHGTTEEAVELMNHLRAEALRLDRHLANPRHKWNQINGDR